ASATPWRPNCACPAQRTKASAHPMSKRAARRSAPAAKLRKARAGFTQRLQRSLGARASRPLFPGTAGILPALGESPSAPHLGVSKSRLEASGPREERAGGTPALPDCAVAQRDDFFFFAATFVG